VDEPVTACLGRSSSCSSSRSILRSTTCVHTKDDHNDHDADDDDDDDCTGTVISAGKVLVARWRSG